LPQQDEGPNWTGRVFRKLAASILKGLAGKANWWLPRSLDRILPRLNVEGSVEHDEPVRKPASHPGPALRPLLEDTVA
jgi:putative drug exporter of the RND superfamily